MKTEKVLATDLQCRNVAAGPPRRCFCYILLLFMINVALFHYCLVADPNDPVKNSVQLFSQVFTLNPTNLLGKDLSFWKELFTHRLSTEHLLHTTPKFRTIAMFV
jgi:hypothetical protein